MALDGDSHGQGTYSIDENDVNVRRAKKLAHEMNSFEVNTGVSPLTGFGSIQRIQLKSREQAGNIKKNNYHVFGKRSPMLLEETEVAGRTFESPTDYPMSVDRRDVIKRNQLLITPG